MELQGITRTVSSLERSKQFYEDVLGFEPSLSYEPTHWQAYRCQGTVFFAVGEEPGSTDEVSLAVPDVEALWERVKDKADVVAPLEKTPWGTYRFVIRDPDDHLLAFAQKQ
jgi:catechol 2,3-dioxygenase-like lactoylglutathione lyase family enzyme